jgi:scyllo-inositol 2-dehydrogenase (NADP+)
MKKVINAGIIGFGLSGRVFHAPFLDTNPGFRLKAIVERSGRDAQELYPGATIVKDYHQLLTDPEIELIVIGTPNTLHFTMAKECIEAGKHIVIEKPFTPTSKEADKLINLSKKSGKKIFVFQNRRWDGDFKTIQKVISDGMLGDLLEYEAHFDRFAPVRKRAAWRDDPLPGSGVLYDLGSHLIDQALVLFGKPLSIFADVRAQRETKTVDDSFEVILFYDRIKVTLKAGVFVREAGPRYIIHGRKGSFTKYGIDPQEELLKQGFMPTDPNWGKEEPDNWGILNTDINGQHYLGNLETEPGNYHGFYDNVYDVIIKEAEQAVKPEEARMVIRIIELAFESNKKKAVVYYED